MRYYFKRVNDFRYYYGFLLGLLIIFLHIVFSVIPTREYLNINTVFLFTPYTKWITFDTNGTYSILFVLALPLFCSLGLNQLVYDDLKSGFWHYKLPHSSIVRYALETSFLSFLNGFVVCTALLSIDLGITFLLLPNIIPNFILNSNTAVLPDFTYFSKLYYTHPLYLFVFYIILSGFIAGLFSLFSGMLSFYIHKKFAVISTGFVVGFVISVLATVFFNQIYSPLLLIIGFSPVYNPPITLVVLMYFVILAIVEMIFVLGVRKNAIL
ncbi:MAG: hypothetical protein ABF483_02330 [Liquorilactobacillus nagelii]|uniref:Uncharacterized protein n=1 Tax=Liquorilactobacillus nagelii TaxID=82688 RepID=A0A3Q8D142_9LACO|nr:hypothetical protein [Liquorilactobacillus nagelii]AUJ32912.1 hypothetical protein BSQ50_10400 [Liquorilactobacillus nagelii]MCC7616341.1 hypothetical protein [Liquorilactobacillus nagelii]MCP9315101.1 hypothetical protein [Liquorilactobacillus nagelii]